MKKLAIFLIMPFGIQAMHTHQSSSISLSEPREQVRRLEQETKIIDEVNDIIKSQSRGYSNKPKVIESTPEEINKFKCERLSQHLLGDLTNIVLDYDKIDPQYYLVQTLEESRHKIEGIIQLRDGSLVSWTFIGQDIKIWRLNENNKYILAQTINKDLVKNKNIVDGCIKCLIELQDNCLAFCDDTANIKILKLNNNGKYDLDREINHSRPHCGYHIELYQLKNGLLVTVDNNKRPKMILWDLNNKKYKNCKSFKELYFLDNKFKKEPNRGIWLNNGTFASISWFEDQKLKILSFEKDQETVIQEIVYQIPRELNSFLRLRLEDEGNNGRFSEIIQLQNGSLAITCENKILIWANEFVGLKMPDQR